MTLNPKYDILYTRTFTSNLKGGNAMKGSQRIEMNFIIKKFLELVKEKQEEIYGLLHSSETESNVKAGETLLELLAQNTEELVDQMNQISPVKIKGWIPYIGQSQYLRKIQILFLHFKEHLKQTDQGFHIEMIPESAVG